MLLMATYVVFLRAINLGSRRRLPMPQVKESLAGVGFDGIETYLATGNVLVETRKRTRSAVETEVEAALAATAGFDVPAIAVSPQELVGAHSRALELGVTAQRRYLTFLKEEPSAELAAELDGWSSPGEGARVLGRAVYWWTEHLNAASKMSNARVEKQLGVATTRDLKVVATLVQRWCS